MRRITIMSMEVEGEEENAPYAHLASELLRRAIRDAAGHVEFAARPRHAQLKANARDFLQDRHAVAFWCDILDVDASLILNALAAVVGQE